MTKNWPIVEGFCCDFSVLFLFFWLREEMKEMVRCWFVFVFFFFLVSSVCPSPCQSGLFFPSFFSHQHPASHL